MSGEFEDVLTNQPVVIDNVRPYTKYEARAIIHKPPFNFEYLRAQEQLKLVSPARIIQNVSSLHCTPHPKYHLHLPPIPCSRNAEDMPLFVHTVSDDQNTYASWPVHLKATYS